MSKKQSNSTGEWKEWIAPGIIIALVIYVGSSLGTRVDDLRNSLNKRIDGLDDSINRRIDDKFAELLRAVDRNSESLQRIEDVFETTPTSTSAPSSSIGDSDFSIFLDADASPLSAYSSDDAVWSGIFVEMSVGVANELGFEDPMISSFSDMDELLRDGANELEYGVAIAAKGQPNTRQALDFFYEEGWQDVPLESCIGFEDYVFVVSPLVAEQAVEFAVNRIPQEQCDEWTTLMGQLSNP